VGARERQRCPTLKSCLAGVPGCQIARLTGAHFVTAHQKCANLTREAGGRQVTAVCIGGKVKGRVAFARCDYLGFFKSLLGGG